MATFILGAVAGAIVASVPWWIKVRGLSGVISDLKDAANNVTTKA